MKDYLEFALSVVLGLGSGYFGVVVTMAVLRRLGARR
jgi:hypothetical protein